MRLIDADDLKSAKFLDLTIAIIGRSKSKDFVAIYQRGWNDAVDAIIDNAPTVSDRYDEGFRDGYAQCINDKEERKENNRLFQKGGKK